MMSEAAAAAADVTFPIEPVRVVKVRHKFWTGDLILGQNGRLRHSQHNTLGSFYNSHGVLHVIWDRHSPDLFLERDGLFVSADLSEAGTTDLRKPLHARLIGRDVEVETVCLRVPGSDEVVSVRPASSDIDVFGAIFIAREYAKPELPGPVRVVVDLGANIGLSSVFFAQRHPEALVLAVEPDAGNMRLLRRNVRPWRRVVPVHAAAWHQDTTLRLRVADPAGAKLPDWAFQVGTAHGAGHVEVEALSIPSLMRRHGIADIDLLKIDIEGAEQELFEHDAAPWLAMTRCVVVETHERFKSGSDGAVTRALADDFDELPQSGENRIFVRRQVCAA